MGLEIGTYISDLVATNPASGDQENQGDDHLRLIKAALKNSLPNVTRPEYFQKAVATSSNTTAVEADDKKVFAVTTTGGDKTFTLPTLDADNAGWEVSVCKVTSDHNHITVTPAAGTISGMTSVVLHNAFELVCFLWTGSIWTIKFGRLPAFGDFEFSADTTLTNVVYGAIVTGDTSGGDVVLTLPTAVGHQQESVLFRRLGTGDLTVEGSGSETINGELIYTLGTNYATIWLVSDGANWMLVASETGSTGSPAFTNIAQSFIAAQTFSDQFILASQTLVDGATIAWDMGEEPVALVASTASRNLGAPDNEVAGQIGFLLVTEDGTGGWVLSLNAAYKTPGGGDIRPDVAVSAATLYMYYVRGANDVLVWKVWTSGKNSIGFYKEYELTGTLSGARKTVTPHLLGRKPALVQLYYRCISADLSYAVGQDILPHNMLRNGETPSITVVSDDTNVTVLSPSDIWTTLSNAATPVANQLMANAKWQPVIRIYE